MSHVHVTPSMSRTCHAPVTRESRRVSRTCHAVPSRPVPSRIKNTPQVGMHRWVANARDADGCMQGAPR